MLAMQRVDVVLAAHDLAARRHPAPADRRRVELRRHRLGLSSFSAGMRRVSSPLASATQLSEHRLEFAHQPDDATDDLAGKILVALRQQHLREEPAHAFGVAHRALQAFVGALRPHRVPTASWREPCSAPLLEQLRGLARHAIDQRAGLLDQVERAMRGLFGQLDHVRQAPARVRHFLVGEHFEARLLAKAPQRRLRIGGDALQFGIELDVELRAQPLERAAERGLVVRVERAGEVSDVASGSARAASRPATWFGNLYAAALLARILSIFSLSVAAVNGLIT